MPKRKRMSLTSFLATFATEATCREYLFQKRWPTGFICPKCGSTRYFRLYSGLCQCSDCHHQTSVTAGTIIHRSHVPLRKWFFTFYFVSQDKRGISAVGLADTIGVTYKTAWYILKRVRTAMGQRDATHKLAGIVEFDDAFFGGPTVGKKRGRGTEKAKVFVALSLNEKGNPEYLKMKVTPNIKQASVKRFAEQSIKPDRTIRSDGYRSYIPALKSYDHEHKLYDPHSETLQWLHIMISNAKTFILGTYHGLPKSNLQSYLDEFCFRFSRRAFGTSLFDRLAFAMAVSRLAYSKG